MPSGIGELYGYGLEVEVTPRIIILLWLIQEGFIEEEMLELRLKSE